MAPCVHTAHSGNGAMYTHGAAVPASTAPFPSPFAPCSCIIMSFEERLPDEEQAILVRLGLGGGAHGGGAGGPPPLHVEELQGAAVRVDFEDSLQRLGAGGHADTDLFNPHLFWECPPVRLFVLRARAPCAPSS